MSFEHSELFTSNQYGIEGWGYDIYSRETQCMCVGKIEKTKCNSPYILLQTNGMKDLQLHALKPKIQWHQGAYMYIQDFYAQRLY